MIQFLFAVNQVHQLLLVQVAQIALKRSTCLEDRNADTLAGLVVVVDLNLELSSVTVRDLHDRVNGSCIVLSVIECLNHIELNRVTTETLQVVLLNVCIVLPDICVQRIQVVSTQLQFLVFQRFLLGLVQNLNSLGLGQTGLQLLIGKTTFLHQLLLRSGLDEHEQRVSIRCETAVLVMILYQSGTQINQILDDSNLTLCLRVLKFNRSSNTRYTEVTHHYNCDTKYANSNNS